MTRDEYHALAVLCKDASIDARAHGPLISRAFDLAREAALKMANRRQRLTSEEAGRVLAKAGFSEAAQREAVLQRIQAQRDLAHGLDDKIQALTLPERAVMLSVFISNLEFNGMNTEDIDAALVQSYRFLTTTDGLTLAAQFAKNSGIANWSGGTAKVLR